MKRQQAERLAAHPLYGPEAAQCTEEIHILNQPRCAMLLAGKKGKVTALDAFLTAYPQKDNPGWWLHLLQVMVRTGQIKGLQVAASHGGRYLRGNHWKKLEATARNARCSRDMRRTVQRLGRHFSPWRDIHETVTGSPLIERVEGCRLFFSNDDYPADLKRYTLNCVAETLIVSRGDWFAQLAAKYLDDKADWAGFAVLAVGRKLTGIFSTVFLHGQAKGFTDWPWDKLDKMLNKGDRDLREELAECLAELTKAA